MTAMGSPDWRRPRGEFRLITSMAGLLMLVGTAPLASESWFDLGATYHIMLYIPFAVVRNPSPPRATP